MTDDSQESSPSAVESPAPGDGIVGIFLLYFSPRQALPLLFSGVWPRCLVTLYLSYLVVPFIVAQIVSPTVGLGQLFIALNKQLPITPEGFTRGCYVVSILGVPAAIFLLSILQKFILRIQGVNISFIDGTAGLVYSVFPLFTVLVLRSVLLIVTSEPSLEKLGLSVINVISALLIPASGYLLLFLQILGLVSLGWGILIWVRFMQGMTALPVERIFATGAVLFAVPVVLLLAVIASYLISSTDEINIIDGQLPSLEHLRDSLYYHPR